MPQKTPTEFPSFEDWTPPWGDNPEDFDADRAAKLIYNQDKDKVALQEKVTTLTTERDELKSKVDEAARKDETEVERLQRELKERDEKLAEASKSGTDIEVLRLKVALKLGLTETQAKRLVGTTEAELEADAEELLKSFGSTGSADDDDDDSGSRNPLKRTPAPRRNPGNPGERGGGEATPSVDEFLKQYREKRGY